MSISAVNGGHFLFRFLISYGVEHSVFVFVARDWGTGATPWGVFEVGPPAAGHTRAWKQSEGSPAPFMIQIRGNDLIPFSWGGLLLGWNRDVTVVAGNQICDVKTEIRGEGRNRMRGIVVTTNGNGDLVEVQRDCCDSAAAVRGWLQLYKYNGNLLQNRSVARSKLLRATQVIAGRTVLFASRKKKSAGGK